MDRLTALALRCPLFRAGEALAPYVVANVPKAEVRERLVLAVTSKIASLAEGRQVARSEIDKDALVRREADVFLGKTRFGVALTIKHGLLIPSAGLDESNSESGDFILYPVDPFATLAALWRELRAAWGVRELGVILTDSHVSPLRRGVTGLALAHWGFGGRRDLVGSLDLFGRELKMTQMNLADGLAATAVLLMGEGAEQCPLAVIQSAPWVEFSEQTDPAELRIPVDEDLYGELYAERLKLLSKRAD